MRTHSLTHTYTLRCLLAAATLFVYLVPGRLTAQVTLGFQGAEPGDPWAYVSTGANSEAQAEALLAPNKITGSQSLVVGGNTGGGSCWAGGSGNGPSTPRTFTFNTLNISTSNFFTRTLQFNWGNRFPACVGTGWDSGENLVFTAFHDGVAQPSVTLAIGNNNATFNIAGNQYTWTVPPCVNTFSFTLSVTTNRRDELLFVDDVKLTSPFLNGAIAQPSAILGNTTVCQGSTQTYSVTQETGIVYTWSGLPAGANFATANGTTGSYTMNVNWGAAVPGTYTLSVTPSTPCGTTGPAQTVNVTVVAPPVISITPSGPTTFCAGGSVTLTSSVASGVTWSPGGSTSGSIVATTSGTYTVSLNSVCGTASASETVTVDPLANATITPQADLCNNDAPVNLTAVDPGGTWTSSCGTCLSATGVFDPSATSAGTHTVTYTIPGSCGDTSTITIDVNPVPDITAASEFICNGQTTGITPTSSVAGTNFSWTITATNVTGASAGSGTAITQTLNLIAPPSGNVVYTITPVAAGCTGSPFNALVNVEEVTIDNITITDISCNGANDGEIQVTATGADGYSMDGGINFQASPLFSGLAPGTYTVVAQNTLGCNASFTVTINEPAQLTVGVSGTSVGCSCNGTATATPGGGTTPYSYAWTGSADVSQTADSLCVGTYHVILTDDHGCTATDSINLTGLPPLTIDSVNTTDPACNAGTNGTIDIFASASATQFSIDGGTSFQPTGNFTGLGAGTYNLMVQDASGCQVSSVAILAQPNALVLNTSANITICPGQFTTVSANASGGIAPYVYTWDNGLSASPSHAVSPAVTTSYAVYVTDNHSCVSDTAVITVTVPVPLSVSAVGNQTICPGAPASITAVAAGGDGDYTYSWTDETHTLVLNGADQTVTPVVTTAYTVTVTDGCSSQASDSVLVNVYTMPQVSFTVDTGSGCLPLTVNFTNTSDTALFTSFDWAFGDGNTSTDVVPQNIYVNAGCYDVTLTLVTNDGCDASATITNFVCAYGLPVADFTWTPVNADVFNPEVTFTNLSVDAITYNWNFAFIDSSETVDAVYAFPTDSAGNYQVCLSAWSNEGCLDTTCKEVEIAGFVTAYVPNAFTPDADGMNDYFCPVVKDVSVENFHFRVFDRWGNVIFDMSNRNDKGWDGTHNGIYCKTDVYVWQLKYREYTGIDREVNGTVTLMR